MSDDWGPYSRVYHRLALDHPIVWNDDAYLAWWLRLLVEADTVFPRPAMLPRALPEEVLGALEAAEILDPEPGGRFLFHGLEGERNGRANKNRKGGLARAARAARTERGRFAPLALVPASTSAAAGEPLEPPLEFHAHTLEPSLEPDAGEFWDMDAGENAGDIAGASAGPAVDPALSSQNKTKGSTPSRDPLGLVPATGSPGAIPAAATIRCDDYRGHQTSGHLLVPGVGWKCVICEAAWAKEDRSFDDKVREYGDPF